MRARPLSGSLATVLVVTLVAALPLLTAGAAAPTDPAEPPPPTVVAVYEVTASETSTGPDGATATDGATGTIDVACVGDVCRVTTEPYHAMLRALALTRASAIVGGADTDAAETACDDGIGGRHLELTADADGLTATLTQEPLGWSDCGDGSEAYSHARSITWTGTLVSAPDCLFTDAGCLAVRPGLATGDAAIPSVLSALVTPATAATSPGQLLLAALVTIILLLLVAFPTALLNSAVESGADRLAAWRETRRAAAGATAGATAPRSWARSWWWAASGVVAAAVVSAFVDPQFGLNAGSGRVVLSILASFGIDVVLGWSALVWIMRRVNPAATHAYAFRPLTLLVVVAAVVFTRVTGFEPGIVFGLVAGVAFGALVGAAAEGKAALVTLGWAFGLALVAWVLYGLVAPVSGESFWATFAVEALAAVAIGGMAALPIALVPLRGLPGRAVWAWSRVVWAVAYAVGLLAFFVVLMPMPSSWDEVGWELWAWIGVYAVYAAVAVAAWLLLSRPWRKDPEPAECAGPAEGAESPEGSEPAEGAAAEPQEQEAEAVAAPADRLEG